ncbi:MAG: ABC transporter permease [Longispora sp.]|nr:ABC transporter permease [Longispora sp. (in: high G+C Gram-positive bacteria)]
MATLTETAPLPAPAPRVSVVDGLRQSATLAWRTLVQIRHNPWELGDFSFQPIMFVLLFTYVFGGAIAASTGEYLTFALPGIIVMNMLFVTMYVGLGLNTDLTKGVFDRLRSLPVARWAPLAGRITADLVKQAWSILLLLGVGFLLGFRVGTSFLGLLAAVVLILVFALAFSWVSVLVGLLAKDPEKVQLFGFTALFPVTFVSNVFVPTVTMPGWLQAVVKVNPVSILSDAARGLIVGGQVAAPVIQTLLWVVALLLIFVPLSIRAFRRRV